MRTSYTVRLGELVRIGRYWRGNREMVDKCLKAWLWNGPYWAQKDPIWAIIEKARQMGTILGPHEAQRIFEESKVGHGVRKAEELGLYLMLPDEVRTRLRIQTIGAHNVDKRTRKRRTKAKNREREAARRRAKGAVPRSQALSRTRPWEARGVSRAQWYRERGIETALAPSLPEWTTPGITEVTDPVEAMAIRAACEPLETDSCVPLRQIRASYT